MPDQDIQKIRIGNNLIGIAGLETVIKSVAAEDDQCSDEEIGAEMLKRLETGNYIPEGARRLYANALVREYRKYQGQSVEEEASTGLHVIVLGPGCAQCDRMEMDVREVMAEMGLAADLNHVTDLKEIGRYGVMGVPALIINDKVVCVGQAPNRRRIREWLSEATPPATVSRET